MHARGFRDAGFSHFRWEELQLYPKADQKFWKEYFDRAHLPVIGMLAIK
jgi:hypothetical protein